MIVALSIAALLMFSLSVAAADAKASRDYEDALSRFEQNDLTGTNPNTALTPSGWTLVGSGDLDGNSTNSNATFGQLNATVSGAGSSSWRIITAHHGSTDSGRSLDKNSDYYKLLSLSGTCTSNIYGGACGTSDNPSGSGSGASVPEPGSFALAAVALAGLGLRRRRTGARHG